jgi:E3 ubiquitin-protein ligase listerin
MSKRQFKGQASSSRVDPGIGFGGFGTVFAGSTLSYLSEPPNLSSITDANVVVAFKNLLKKDSTTKAKGLEDLRSYVQSHPYEHDGGVEEPVLEAWVGYLHWEGCKRTVIVINR